MCPFDHYLLASYLNYQESEPPHQFKSIKFKLRLYNTITKKKVLEKDTAFD